MKKKNTGSVKAAVHVQFQRKLRRQNLKPSTKGDAVKYLLAHEEIVNQKDDDGDTPLMNASDAGCIESVKVLLARKALVNTVSDDGFTALHLSAQYKDDASIVITKLLIEAGAAIDDKSQMGWTPLMLAQRGGNVQLQALLIGKGADTQAFDRHMKVVSALFVSLKNRQEDKAASS